VRASELADGHGPSSGESFDVVVGARHVAVLVVDHHATQMLDDVGTIQAALRSQDVARLAEAV
jgi:hypothetical protein